MKKSGYHSTWNAAVAFLSNRDGYLCQICHKKLDDSVSIDHIIPKSIGGEDLLSNFRLAHKGCNISHFRKNFSSKRNPCTQEHKNNISKGNKEAWDEIRAGIRKPHTYSSEIKRKANLKWWAKKSKEERAAIRKKAWETRRANR